jgi:hypothetical protein
MTQIKIHKQLRLKGYESYSIIGDGSISITNLK